MKMKGETVFATLVGAVLVAWFGWIGWTDIRGLLSMVLMFGGLGIAMYLIKPLPMVKRRGYAMLADIGVWLWCWSQWTEAPKHWFILPLAVVGILARIMLSAWAAHDVEALRPPDSSGQSKGAIQ
jgi:hypothetical protein